MRAGIGPNPPFNKIERSPPNFFHWKICRIALTIKVGGMGMKKLIVSVFALLSTGGFAKGLLLNGTYTGVSPFEPDRQIEITFRLESGSELRVVGCNFNVYCFSAAMADELRPVADASMYQPNGDFGWRVSFVRPTSDKPIFQVVTAEPESDTPVLKLLGLGIDVPLKKK